jgi:hypothetical protein
LKVTDISYDEMLTQLIKSLRAIPSQFLMRECDWITGYDENFEDCDMEDFLTYFITDEDLFEYLQRRFLEVGVARMTSRIRRSSDSTAQLEGLDYKSFLEKCVQRAFDNAIWEVEDAEGVLRVRFFEFVPARPDTSYWVFLSFDGEETRYGSIANHWKIETFRGKLVATAGVKDGSRTRKMCPQCRQVVNPTTEMFTINQGRSRPIKVCVPCTVFFHDFYELSTGQFHYVGSDLDNIVPFNETDIRVTDLRNIKRYNLMDWLSVRVGVVPFIPNYRQEDYNTELHWSYWQTTDRGSDAIPSGRYGDRIQMDINHESKQYAKQGIPMGMELEVQYRDVTDELTNGIRKLLAPLHKDFPYGNERLRSTNNQLAIGTYDVSTGRHGLEFKFQPMSHQFIAQLPADFFESLTSEFRGYHAKRCGIHMNIPKNVMSTGQYWFFIAWHNMRLWEYTHENEDNYHNFLGDIYQRVDVDYAKWLALTERDILAQGPNFRCGCHDGAPTVTQIACSTGRYLVNNYRSPERNCWINIENAERLEVRAFASNTMKDRILKNFQFLDAFLTYADAVTMGYKVEPNNRAGVQSSFDDAYELADRTTVLSHLNDQNMFTAWLMQSGYVYTYPELTEYLQRTGYVDRAQEALSNDKFNEHVQTAVNWS